MTIIDIISTMKDPKPTNKKDRTGREIIVGDKVECLVYNGSAPEVVDKKRTFIVKDEGPDGFFPFNRERVRLETTEVIS